MTLHHVGVAVDDLEKAIQRHVSLGMKVAHREEVPSQGVRVAFLGAGPFIELLEPLRPDSPVGRFLAKHGPGQHHVAYAVEDLPAALAREKAAGREPIDPAPRLGAWGHQVAFLHPKNHGGVLVELLELSRTHG